jgi:RNA polymerase sigma factor (sigma-70 family)
MTKDWSYQAMDIPINENGSDSSLPETLLTEACAGNLRAFGEIITLHWPALRRFISIRFDKTLQARLDPEDVAQDTLVEVFRRLESYRNRRPMPFPIWLWNTGRQQLLKAHRNHIKTARRALGREEPLSDQTCNALAYDVESAGTSAGQQIDETECAALVRRALGQLSWSDQEIVRFRTYQEFSFKRIASILTIRPTAARKRFGRALSRLRLAFLERQDHDRLSCDAHLDRAEAARGGIEAQGITE